MTMFIGKIVNSVLSWRLFSRKDKDDMAKVEELNEIATAASVLTAASDGKEPETAAAPATTSVTKVSAVAALAVPSGSKQPATPAAGGENKEDVDGLFTKMNTVAAQPEVDIKDILQPVIAEEKSGKTEEKAKEAVVKSSEGDKEKAGLMSTLFEQDEGEENSAMVNLIASLPDVTAQELLDGANEVKALMGSWQTKASGDNEEQSSSTTGA